MRVLTVRQPWAWAIIHGGKDVENRSRNIAGGYRGSVAIHAGAAEDTTARAHPEIIRLARETWWTTPADLLTGRRDQFRHIIGVVDLVDVHPAGAHYEPIGAGVSQWTNRPCCGTWAERGGHHLVLAHPRPLADPIPFKGGLGLRRLDEEMTARVLAGIEREDEESDGGM